MTRHDLRSGQGTDMTPGRALGRRLSRRRVVGAGLAGSAALAVGTLSRFGASARVASQEQAPAEGIRGGRLRVATTGQPAGLDMQLVGQRTITLIGWNMFEALFTFDADYATVPMLAEGIEVSEDGLTNRITLRQGVPFHNGDEMQAADVVASFNR